MYLHDNEDRAITRFIFVSVILHALLFLTFPKWSALFLEDLSGFERGGVIQVVHVESSLAREPSAETDRSSQAVAPRTAEPRPTPEPPQEQAVAQPVEDREEQADPPAPQPRPEPPEEQPAEVIPEVRPEPEPQPRPEPEPEPEPQPEPEPVPEPPVRLEPPVDPPAEERPQPEITDTDQLLTSERGPEVVVEERELPRPEPLPEPEPVRSEPPAPTPVPESPPLPEPTAPSASGTVDGSVETDADEAIIESGTGEEDTAPPPPPPPPSGRSLHAGGGTPVYPKDAEHDGVEGLVGLEVEVTSSGETVAVRVTKSSGDQRLDEQAKRTIERLWQFRGAAHDYLIDLEVEFARLVEGGLVTYSADVYFGEVRWVLEE